MDNATERITAGLRKAMQLETEGEHFYLMAAESAEDPGGRQTLRELADEERQHYDFLRAQLSSITKTGEVDETTKLGTPHKFSSEHPIFSPEIRARISKAHFEVTALSIGILLERNSIHFYQGEARAADDPRVSEFYTELATWEQGHLVVLQQEAEWLRDDYWMSAHFAPF